MKVNTLMGITAGKSAHFALSKMGRGLTLPGKIALKFDKDVLDTIAEDCEIATVTGVDGKTLTTALTVRILRETSGGIVTNPSGANIITGITLTPLTTKKAKFNKKIAVLEIDGASLSETTECIIPSLFIFTNIPRGQTDHYGETYTTYQMILDGAAKASTAAVLANGNSPLLSSTDVISPVKYYGFDAEKYTPELAHCNTEGILCPQYQQTLKYKLNTYVNLGDYVCENYDFHHLKLDYALTELTKITNITSESVIDGQDYKINVDGSYNICNALAAVSVVEFFEIASEKIKTGFDKSRAVFGRRETFKVGNESYTLVLIKSPVSASQAFDVIKLAPYPFTLSVLLNTNYADGTDTGWVWSVNFEAVLDMDTPQVFAGGVCHSEIIHRLCMTGYDENNITEVESLEKIMALIESQTTEHVYILATYTAMLQFREILASRHAAGREMN